MCVSNSQARIREKTNTINEKLRNNKNNDKGIIV